MREIKFRAWNTSQERIIPFHEMEDDHYDLFNEFRHGIIMQYTGLKDKNGKEIYEGDIVKLPNFMFAGYGPSIDGGLTASEYYEDLKGTVKWEDAAFMINDMPLHATIGYEIEVIGNIYENSNILKDGE